MIQAITADTAVADETKIKVLAQRRRRTRSGGGQGHRGRRAGGPDKALPALDAAVQALKLLTKNDIVEVKALKNYRPATGWKMEVAVSSGRSPRWWRHPRGRETRRQDAGLLGAVHQPGERPGEVLGLAADVRQGRHNGGDEKADPYMARDDFEPADQEGVRGVHLHLHVGTRHAHLLQRQPRHRTQTRGARGSSGVPRGHHGRAQGGEGDLAASRRSSRI